MSNVVEGMKADHQKYIVPDLIDAEVVERQSRKQEAEGESTWVHYHAHGEPCKGQRHQAYGHVLNVSGNLFQPLLNKQA